eukprot:c2909_g1_i1 orf=1-207(-)
MKVNSESSHQKQHKGTDRLRIKYGKSEYRSYRQRFPGIAFCVTFILCSFMQHCNSNSIATSPGGQEGYN